MSFNFVCFLLLLRVDVEDVGGLGEVHLGVVAEPNVYEVLVLLDKKGLVAVTKFTKSLSF